MTDAGTNARDLADKIRHNGERLIDHPDDHKALAAMYCEVNGLRKDPNMQHAVEHELTNTNQPWWSLHGLFGENTSTVTFEKGDDGRVKTVSTERVDNGVGYLFVPDLMAGMGAKLDWSQGLPTWKVQMVPDSFLDKKPDCSPKPTK